MQHYYLNIIYLYTFYSQSNLRFIISVPTVRTAPMQFYYIRIGFNAASIPLKYNAPYVSVLPNIKSITPDGNGGLGCNI